MCVGDCDYGCVHVCVSQLVLSSVTQVFLCIHVCVSVCMVGGDSIEKCCCHVGSYTLFALLHKPLQSWPEDIRIRLSCAFPVY